MGHLPTQPNLFVPPPPPDPITLVRPTDPVTSQLAAWSIADATKVQKRILHIFYEFGDVMPDAPGMTDEELRAQYRMIFGPCGESSIRSRRNDLVGHGLIEASEVTRTLTTGRLGVVWRLTVRGAQAAAHLGPIE